MASSSEPGDCGATCLTLSAPPAACWSSDSLLADRSRSAACDLEDAAANISLSSECAAVLCLLPSHENTETDHVTHGVFRLSLT